MGSNIGKDQKLCSRVTQVVKEVAKVPVWSKLTPSTTDIAMEAGAVFRGGADAVVSSNTFPSLPLIDPETLEFEMNVDGLVSSGGLGGPAILPQSLAKMAQMTRAFPEKSFSGIGGISDFRRPSTTSCSAAAPCRSARRPCSTTRSGPNVIKRLLQGCASSWRRTPTRGWKRLDDFRGLRREPRRAPLADPAPGGLRLPRRLRDPGRLRGAGEGRGEALSTTLVRNGTIVTASDRYEADIYIDKGVVTLIGQGLTMPADTVIDASGKLVMPGGIDVHTHLDMPFGGTTSADDFETGTDRRRPRRHHDHRRLRDPGLRRGPLSRLRRLDEEGRGQGRHRLRVPHDRARADATRSRATWTSMTRHEGVTSFKLFMAYPGVFMVDDATIFQALLRTKENGGLICMHAENGGVIDTLVKEALRQGQTAPKYHALTRPTRAEGEATGRAIALAEMAGVPIYIVHLSCSDALEKVKQARDMGLPAYAETCPQYLFLSYEDYERPGFEGAKYVMSPPLREKWNQDALWKGLAKNDLQVVSTDHCPFCMNEPPQKQLGKDDFSKIPNGAPGIETRLMLLWDGGVRAGRIDAHRFVEITSTNPAAHVRPLAEEGHDRRRLRRRPRALGPRQGSARSPRRRTTCASTTTPTRAAR